MHAALPDRRWHLGRTGPFFPAVGVRGRSRAACGCPGPDGDGARRAEHWAGDAGDVSLAFACTVHRAQDGEFPHVVCALGWDAFKLLSRCHVSTAVSRARDTLPLVRETGSLEYAAAHAEDVRRYRWLGYTGAPSVVPRLEDPTRGRPFSRPLKVARGCSRGASAEPEGIGPGSGERACGVFGVGQAQRLEMCRGAA